MGRDHDHHGDFANSPDLALSVSVFTQSLPQSTMSFERRGSSDEDEDKDDAPSKYSRDDGNIFSGDDDYLQSTRFFEGGLEKEVDDDDADSKVNNFYVNDYEDDASGPGTSDTKEEEIIDLTLSDSSPGSSSSPSVRYIPSRTKSASQSDYQQSRDDRKRPASDKAPRIQQSC